jgi:Peptidase family M28/PA domain/PDZ domain/WD40-like Beta Propeller Repeat
MVRAGALGPVVALWLAAGCAAARPGAAAPRGGAPPGRLWAEETAFFADLQQLTFGGENAEAYWSFDGRQLSFQARPEGEGCDRIYRIAVDARPPAPVPVSSGKGATTCAHFFPGGDLLFASTHLAGEACPPRPDRSRGYVWAVYDSYDIFRVAADGSGLRRLTSEKGYDAEGTVCARDGSIVFTSTRDGDLELYRMDRDGGNVRRLTRTPGYDGGAFFNRDCSRIVWRASRPRPGPELQEYQSLLAQGLVRPKRLEIWTADADGSNPVQVTNLGAASFAPSFHPTEDVIVFSSNHGDPHEREFDLWAIRPDGSGLTRLTYAPGFDGFPLFSPDGARMAFSSNRATAPGHHDTNVFVVRWRGLSPAPVTTATDRIAQDVGWLADPVREGRGLGTQGLAQAGAYLETRLRALGLEPAGDDGSFRHRFPVVTEAAIGPATRLVLDGQTVAPDAVTVLGFSASGRAQGAVALAGHGIVDEKLGLDDYAGVNARGKIVLVRRFVPEGFPGLNPGQRTRLGDLRRKAWAAREHGARALLVVDWPSPPSPAPPDWKEPPEAALPTPTPEGPGDAGIPVMMVKRAAVAPVLARLAAGRGVRGTLETALVRQTSEAFNVVGRLRAGRLPARGALVIGAHYDHLGYGGRSSLAPEKHEPHPGADDNASGAATVLEVARALAARRAELSRDVVVALFSGEEAGLLGSTQFVRQRAALLAETVAMLNLDMVGRLRANRLEVLGSETAPEWAGLLSAACAAQSIDCAPSSDGFGASDQAAFYNAGLPVLHFFTGTHSDYHKPSDVAARINAAGAASIAGLVERVAVGLEGQQKLTYHQGVASADRGDARTFNASLGTVPDYAGPPGGAPGVLLAGVRPGGAADRAGLRAGDILLRLGPHEIRSVQDLAFALGVVRPGETLTALVIRAGKELRLETTLQEGRSR